MEVNLISTLTNSFADALGNQDSMHHSQIYCGHIPVHGFSREKYTLPVGVLPTACLDQAPQGRIPCLLGQ
jgi:hypothetical protein